MINYYYSDRGDDVLIVDINKKWFVMITDYGKNYDYEEAVYSLQKYEFPFVDKAILLNSNDLFKKSLKEDNYALYKNLVKTVFQQGDK